MTTRLKVYGVAYVDRGKSVRAVIAAHNKREVALLTGHSLYYVNGYWGETWNLAEVAAAMDNPCVLMISDERGENFRSDLPASPAVKEKT